MDSMALLWDLSLGPAAGVNAGEGRELIVAHLDHGMRPGSAADAGWLSGICRAWGLRLVRRRLRRAVVSEEEARVARYDFLEEVRRTAGAEAILTAHHADDQAETVLFRVLRGTGVAGLQGIPARRGVIHRPMLHRTRKEIEGFVGHHRVPFRLDPSNRSRRFARNRIRHDVIPVLEAQGVGEVSRNLLRLARNARRAEEERKALEQVAFQAVLRSPRESRRQWAVSAMAGWPEALRRRLLRSAARSLGASLSSASTEVGVRAMASLRAGQGVDLSGGIRLSRGRDEWVLQASGDGVWEEVEIGRAEPCVGTFRLGERRFRYEWRPAAGRPDPGGTTSPALNPVSPMRLRGWLPGDRIRLSYGSKPVAKLLAEHGVPAVDRRCTPLLVGPLGAVLWVPGTAVAVAPAVPSGADAFVLRCTPEAHD
jgi:tRNA(Ile)-lysidine synthase